MQSRKVCYLCGRNGNGDPLERHHIFGAANRKFSEQDGLWVWLCGDRCHRNGHDSVHRNAAVSHRLKQCGQIAWECTYGNQDEFVKRYGENYLEELNGLSSNA